MLIITFIRFGISIIFLISVIPNVYTNEKQSPQSVFIISTHDLTVLVNKNETFSVWITRPIIEDVKIKFIIQHERLISLDPHEFTVSAFNIQNQSVNVRGQSPGSSEVTAVSVPNETWIVRNLFVRITVANSQGIIYVSQVFGWFYFIAWSVSFYPQIYINFRRKSVIGLNFDYLALNLVGFTLYSIFNCGLFWVPAIQSEYSDRHPRGLNPVLINDVVFSLHAMFATIITICQSFLYERADQRVSKIASGLLGIFGLFVVISAGLAIGNIIHWLDFLYYCSYVKLTITIIKYIPQALMNYRRKSTVGWSIGNILLDFTGGTLSMLQMILNAYNYDDWASIFGDPTKFGLGLFSALFDLFFMLQHYILYRHRENKPNSCITEDTQISTSNQNASTPQQ